MRASSLVPVFVFGALLGCDAGGPGVVGAPCNTADDCETGLICDEHNNQGSCQEPHGHTGGETTDDSSSGSASGTTTTSAETGTPDETTGAVDTEGAESSGSTTGEVSGETEGSSELCVAFCGCMQSTCSSYDAYPYADEAACLTACEALDGGLLQCFGGFCEQAVNSEGTLVEHYCEHAWGELGTEKC